MYFDRKQTEALGVDVQPDVNREGNELVTDLVDFTAQGLPPAADPVSGAPLSLLSPRGEVQGHPRGRNQPPNPNTRLLLDLWTPLTPATTTWGGFQGSQGPLCTLPAPPRVCPLPEVGLANTATQRPPATYYEILVVKRESGSQFARGRKFAAGV